VGQIVYVTKRGLGLLQHQAQQLEAELRRLQSQTAYAAEVGGNQYHDNSSYEYLVLQIRTVDRRLTETHELLNRIEVVETPQDPQWVQLGTTVTLTRDKVREMWHIVGFGEGDWNEKRISYGAALVQKLIGARVGDTRFITIDDDVVALTVVSIARLEEVEHA